MDGRDREDRPAEYMQGLARGLSVIRAFTAERPRMTKAEIAGETGLTRATVGRCLATLQDLGYVASSDRLFTLTPRVLELGYSFLSAQGIGERIHPLLKAASAELGETCMLGLLDGEEVVYVSHATGDVRFLTIRLTVGSRLPLLSTAIGRALVAFLPDEDRARLVETAPLRPHTTSTVTERQAVAMEIARVRREGFAINEGEYEDGLISLGVPVLGPAGTALGALNVVTIKDRATRERLATAFVPVLRECAEKVAIALT